VLLRVCQQRTSEGTKTSMPPEWDCTPAYLGASQSDHF
jgi:hypothetical protein